MTVGILRVIFGAFPILQLFEWNLDMDYSIICRLFYIVAYGFHQFNVKVSRLIG